MSKNRVSSARGRGYDGRMSHYERIEKVIRYLDAHAGEQPDLATLAKVAGLSESHFHRLFAKWAGTTPKDFLKHLTSEHAKALLRESKDILGASLEAGLSGPSRLHDLLVTVEGVTPGEYKSGGRGVAIDWAFVETPFGPCLLGATRRGICWLAFTDRREAALRELRSGWPNASLRAGGPLAKAAARAAFGRGKRKVSVVAAGTPFQLKVWRALLRVPEGRLTTYGALAAAIGAPKAARAVGTAVGRNAIGYLIPCHRVIRDTGALGGYRWGPSRKAAILAYEAARA